ncbi:methyltransferase domain-containing protein [Nitrincola schmidtii]|uniref:methyltransferase domain-containing protein n=1 Tax=Nitrincola schmidtii TaxID=1730894 RepID=UPI00124DE9DF|nr:methyltransferase domain-containing protein [Nitrincola schmidtii]
MDNSTGKYYSTHAKEIIDRYDSVKSPVATYLPLSFKSGSKLLDVGCGSGRDVIAALELGYDAYGVEPSDALREISVEKHPELSNRILEGSLPKLALSEMYDGILCSAVFMHIPIVDQVDALISMRNLLQDQGRLLISIPAPRTGLNNDHRDSNGRLFTPINSEQLKLLCIRLGFRFISQFDNEDALNRSDVRWYTLLFEKGASKLRSLDRIESVLRNDRKVATYKLALMRAFCDLADQDERTVSWLTTTEVGIPIQHIVMSWLRYYWSFCDGRQLIPQNNAEANSGKPIAFRSALTTLRTEAEKIYGNHTSSLALLMLDIKRGKVPHPLINLLKQAKAVIQRTIVEGPIKYTDDGAMYRFDRKSGLVFLDAELWTEFCLNGYWIRNSLLLRWVELTKRFAERHDPSITTGLVLGLLEENDYVQREQSLARSLYLNKPKLQCVWSGKSVNTKTLDVDHALPFSVSRNNDLWNLLPASRTINQKQKRDLVPSPALIMRQQDNFFDNWQFIYEVEPELFEFEVSRAINDSLSAGWEEKLLAHLKLGAEKAIYGRGCKPWVHV